MPCCYYRFDFALRRPSYVNGKIRKKYKGGRGAYVGLPPKMNINPVNNQNRYNNPAGARNGRSSNANQRPNINPAHTKKTREQQITGIKIKDTKILKILSQETIKDRSKNGDRRIS